MDALIPAFVVALLAELGDRTQLLAQLLGMRFRRPVAVLAGIALAAIVNMALAGVVGGRDRRPYQSSRDSAADRRGAAARRVGCSVPRSSRPSRSTAGSWAPSCPQRGPSSSWRSATRPSSSPPRSRPGAASRCWRRSAPQPASRWPTRPPWLLGRSLAGTGAVAGDPDRRRDRAGAGGPRAGDRRTRPLLSRSRSERSGLFAAVALIFPNPLAFSSLCSRTEYCPTKETSQWLTNRPRHSTRRPASRATRPRPWPTR